MFYVVLYLAKLTNFLIRIFKKGAGFTWPGHLALKLYPSLFQNTRIHFPRGIIYVSGTNGKTTTTKLITHICENNSVKVLHNKSGANLLNGIASTILLDRNIFGKALADLAVFEVDEFTLPHLIKKIPPTVLILLNLSRDQLDRYGEIDVILERWERILAELDPRTVLILDATQKKFDVLSKAFKGKIFYFNDNLDNVRHTKLLGDFNAKNVNAAVTAAGVLGIGPEKAAESLEGFDAAYGRGEIIEYSEKMYHLFLAKNPTSFNNNMDLLTSGETFPDTILFILNDDPRDGRDVSWIYDISREKLFEACRNKEIFVSGSRCLDMAVRLEYAGIPVKKDNISLSLAKLVKKISGTPHVKSVAALPNYSAMLELREVLLGRQIL
ncbi:Mur ligase family protein [candidate division WWE3 bacterium]|jgi:UDP-N-acetylmuramyl tripeptide synthase|uniref:Lipid II isoglutaminyl synthase (glutamine-hydrolyzing) subunit MurT n=1 Tax=candidate division WWE3 bacterium TaxID=2053526 RepID=A0A3A4ZJ56_UNCKA|nr:MAG: Mur ligase family protein [candidate division WWE3 bacterium]